MITVTIDDNDLFDKKCNDKKYIDYLDKNKWIETNWNDCKRFDCSIPKTKAIENYNYQLNMLNLSLNETIGECVICGSTTPFLNATTNHYVCCEECKCKDNSTNTK